MTAIASFESMGYPVVVGDILLSQERPPAPLCSVPSASDIIEMQLASSDFRISGYAQKVVLPTDLIAMGWAGDMHASQIATRALKDFAVNPSFSLDQFGRAIAPVDERINGFGLAAGRLHSKHRTFGDFRLQL